MKMTFFLTALKTGALLVCLAILGGCAAPKGYDYTAFLESKPASILVLPPVNQSPDVKASYSLYSQVTLPLSEAGYYVMPVGVVDETFKQNGLMNAEEVRQASPQKLREIFGADSVLYLDVTEYGSSYKIISSEVAVTASAKLVDLRNGKLLWEGTARASSAEQQQNNGGGLVGMLIVALVDQVVNTLSDRGHEIAGITSIRLLSSNTHNGILPGPRARPDAAR
ncbi:hypothetical protein SAMN05216213_10160 [Ectopseudomonas guguanensis]|uniref:Lipoprotein n=2 Tax=Ectopseudomonas guguanensis TaxID=1198456 RepID=A0A1H0JLS1_9GAMM|nr:DUF799 domain-containing protein [Pseudomonas guguanensis]SDO44433.1 hypothetical protein SAMN05216213_10160 [Pseudomonas guguanensis]